jgi:hypothetical protein
MNSKPRAETQRRRAKLDDSDLGFFWIFADVETKVIKWHINPTNVKETQLSLLIHSDM